MTPYRAAAALTAALASTSCVINVSDRLVVREERVFTVSGEPELTLVTFDGSIDVASWDRNDVRVEIEKRGRSRDAASAPQIEVVQDGSRIRIEARRPRIERRRVVFPIGVFHSSSVRFIARVPRKMRLVAQTGDGSIVVDEVGGAIDLRSGDGRIRVNGRLEDLHVDTDDGAIVIEAAEGSAMKNDWDVSTGDGSIVVRLPSQFDAEIDADSDDGRVRSSLPELASGRRDRDRESLRGRLGAGGHVVRLRSGDGSIRIDAR